MDPCESNQAIWNKLANVNEPLFMQRRTLVKSRIQHLLGPVGKITECIPNGNCLSEAMSKCLNQDGIETRPDIVRHKLVQKTKECAEQLGLESRSTW